MYLMLRNDGFLVAAVRRYRNTKNTNIDAEFTGLEGNMMVFLSETTKLEMNWLFLDHEVSIRHHAIDYLNPAGAPVVTISWSWRSRNWPCYSCSVHTNGRVCI